MKQNLFKETPRRFHYSVMQDIKEACSASIKKRNRLSHPMKTVLTAGLVIALLPSAVFGATKLYGLLSQKEGAYGVKLSLSDKAEGSYPEYVKLVVNPPEGFETRPNLGEEKYCRVGEEPTSGFSMALFRFQKGDDISVLERDVDSLTQTVMSGHPAYLITPIEGYGGWDRLYLYFENVNITMLLYYHDVTQEELNAFVEGLSFKEGTKSDHTFVSAIEPDHSDTSVVYDFKEVFKELPRDTVITYSGYNENHEKLRLSSSISNIRVTENIASLDRDDFNDLYPYDEIADENGDLLPKTTRIIQEGDGVNTPTSKIIREEESDQVMILADITYTNLSGEDTLAYVDYWLNTLRKNADGSFSHAEIIDAEKQIYANEYCDTERNYQSDHSENLKEFYSFPLSAHEIKTVTVGFRCNKDMLDSAYLILYNNDASIESIGTDEDLSGVNRCIFKVK